MNLETEDGLRTFVDIITTSTNKSTDVEQLSHTLGTMATKPVAGGYGNEFENPENDIYEFWM